MNNSPDEIAKLRHAATLLDRVGADLWGGYLRLVADAAQATQHRPISSGEQQRWAPLVRCSLDLADGIIAARATADATESTG